MDKNQYVNFKKVKVNSNITLSLADAGKTVDAV